MRKLRLNKYYWWCLSAGTLCFLLFLKLIPNFPEWASILLDIISVLAGGVFASAIVAIFVELINIRKQEADKEFLKSQVFADIVNWLEIILSCELRNVNLVYKLLHKEKKWVKSNEKLTFFEGIDYILNKLNEITPQLDSDYLQSIPNDKDIESINYCLTQNGLVYYEKLAQELNRIDSSKFLHYINHLLKDEDNNKINYFYLLVQDLIRDSKVGSLETVIESMKAFFVELKNFVEYFSMADDVENYKISGSIYVEQKSV